MAKRFKKSDLYPFEWIDEIVEQKLNWEHGSLEKIFPQELAELNLRVQIETRKVLFLVKRRAFCLFSSTKISTMVLQYQNALQLLRSQARVNLDNCSEVGPLRDTCQLVVDQLDDLGLQLQRRFPTYLLGKEMTDGDLKPIPANFSLHKILCRLSVDQLGIILKAADDTKLIISRSLSMIFKSIVPYLSTENKKELSWDSMRSNSYHPEAADKELAIRALEAMIQKIKEYR